LHHCENATLPRHPAPIPIHPEIHPHPYTDDQKIPLIIGLFALLARFFLRLRINFPRLGD
jgi:hypothetical protein